MLSREELERIPIHYRWLLKLLLKLPSPSFPYFILRKLPEIEAIFWAVVAPIILIIYFYFTVWSVAFFSTRFVFPFNLLIGLLAPAIIFVLFLRIQLERTILWWKNIQNPTKEWNVSKVAEELAELIKEQRRRKTQRSHS